MGEQQQFNQVKIFASLLPVHYKGSQCFIKTPIIDGQTHHVFVGLVMRNSFPVSQCRNENAAPSYSRPLHQPDFLKHLGKKAIAGTRFSVEHVLI